MAEDDKDSGGADPAATASPGVAGSVSDLEKCPTCGRRLLTTRSVLCNWCGAVIKNEVYQQRAAEERAQLDAELKRQVDLEQDETARLGVIGRLKLIKKMGRKADPLA